MYRRRRGQTSFKVPFKEVRGEDEENHSHQAERNCECDVKTSASGAMSHTTGMQDAPEALGDTTIPDNSSYLGSGKSIEKSEISVETGHGQRNGEEHAPYDASTVHAGDFAHHGSYQDTVISLADAIAPKTEVVQPKRKRMRLETSECQQLSSSAEGSLPLTQPSQVVKSSKDPHRGLYPRVVPNTRLPRAASATAALEDPCSSGQFIKASALTQAIPVAAQNKLAEEAVQKSSDDDQSYDFKMNQRRGKRLPPQKNTLTNYFTAKHNQAAKSAFPTAAHAEDCGEDIVLIGEVKRSNSAQSKLSCMPSTSSSTCTPVDCSDDNYIAGESKRMPSLPSLECGNKNPERTDSRRLKRSRRHATLQRAKDVGPAMHSLEKATFLYGKSPPPMANPKKHKTSDKYGLLGSGNYPSTSKEEANDSPFDRLPYEIMENIFCRLPMMDLLLNLSRVCTLWTEVISHPTFLPWKKRYHGLKVQRREDTQEVLEFMDEADLKSHESFLPNLLRWMPDFKVVTSPNMDACLRKHAKYQWACSLLKERIPECFGSDKVPNPWCMIAALVIISEYVSDITEIYQVLLSPSSLCTAYEVIECLYCLATVLLAFTRSYHAAAWNGMHYRLYYALYLLENESTTTSDQLKNAASHGRGGQQSLLKYSEGSTVVQMTHEQLRICNHNVGDGDIIKIVAFAGTGKTTTLVKYTRLRPNMKFLLVVFNKSVELQAKASFPKNVTCKTGHSLAFGYVGRKYAAAGKLGKSSLKVTNILNHFTACKGESLYVQAKFVIDTLNRFMASADPFITTAHVPEVHKDNDGKQKPIDHQHRMHYAEQAQGLWDKMVDLNNPMPITHDTYLKIYQLQKPRIYGYNVILIDEAQDMTPALADVLISQRYAKILVGDPHQQIYAFRGAVNAMRNVDASHTFYLTQSFRFGSQIAFVAASCLSLLKGVKKKTLVGNATCGSVRGGVTGQLAIITRSNFTLFAEAVSKCCYSSDNRTIAFVGGIASYGLDTVLDIYHLMNNSGDGANIKNKFIARFPSLGELEKYAIKTSDMELLGKIKIVKTYHHMLPSHIRKIEQRCIHVPELADILLSTAHKAKGLEFSTVRLTDDFMIDEQILRSPNEAVPEGNLNDDESNILYVAVTRAKKQLIMTKTLKALLKRAGENFLYPVQSKKLADDGVHMKCAERDVDFEPTALTLVRRGVDLGETREARDEVLSPEIVYEDNMSLRSLYGRAPGMEGVGGREATDEEPEGDEEGETTDEDFW